MATTTSATPFEAPLPRLTKLPLNCTFCEKPDSQRCGQCKAAAYCSKECQKKDWPSHKMLCKSFTKFQLETPRPSKNHVLALAFKPDTPVPEFVWIKICYNRTFGIDDCSADVANIVFPSSDRTATPLRFHYNPRSGGYLNDHMVDMHYNDTFVFDGSSVNKAIKAVIRPYGHLSWEWRGPVVALAVGRQQTNWDIDLKHFRDIIDNLIYYNSGKTKHPNVRDLKEEDFFDSDDGYDEYDEDDSEDDEVLEHEDEETLDHEDNEE